MPNRIPTPGIATPPVRVSKAAHGAVKPVENSGNPLKVWGASGANDAKAMLARKQ